MHEYMRRLNLAMEKGIIDAGSAAVAEVHHDDNGKRKCGIYSGRECDCDPDIIIRTADGRKMMVTANGEVMPAK